MTGTSTAGPAECPLDRYFGAPAISPEVEAVTAPDFPLWDPALPAARALMSWAECQDAITARLWRLHDDTCRKGLSQKKTAAMMRAACADISRHTAASIDTQSTMLLIGNLASRARDSGVKLTTTPPCWDLESTLSWDIPRRLDSLLKASSAVSRNRVNRAPCPLSDVLTSSAQAHAHEEHQSPRADRDAIPWLSLEYAQRALGLIRDLSASLGPWAPTDCTNLDDWCHGLSNIAKNRVYRMVYRMPSGYDEMCPAYTPTPGCCEFHDDDASDRGIIGVESGAVKSALWDHAPEGFAAGSEVLKIGSSRFVLPATGSSDKIRPMFVELSRLIWSIGPDFVPSQERLRSTGEDIPGSDIEELSRWLYGSTVQRRRADRQKAMKAAKWLKSRVDSPEFGPQPTAQ